MFDTYASIREIHTMYNKKEITVKKVILSFLSRIAEIDSCAGGLKSVIEINPDALFIAETLDRALPESNELPPLFGIPVLLKDNINTADRLHTSAGSVALADNYAPYDAHIVKRLRQAGAVILGKANMTEFANFMTLDGMPSGYSSRGGQTLCPYNRDENPSGSSSGSAAAVAAGLCTVSAGTETSGSITSPAGRNGIVGIKPTLGLVGRSGIIPISSTHDTAGPMARTVWDAAVLLGVLAGKDPGDVATHSGKHIDYDYTRHLGGENLEGIRIGIHRPRSANGFAAPELSEESKTAFDRLCGMLSDAGAVLVDSIHTEPVLNMMKIMLNEFKACLNYYLSTLQGRVKMKTLADIIAYNQAHSAAALTYGQSLLLDAENKTTGAMTEPAYIEGLMERERMIAGLDKIFDENDIHVLLCETSTNLAPFTGFPSMTIPIGQKKNKMPLDSHWIARRFDEASLLRAAYAAEKRLGLCLKPD